MKWLAECAAAALAEALRVVAPEQRGCPVTVPGPVAEDDPLRGVIQCAHRQAVHREVRVVSPGRAPPGARDRRADRVRSRAGGPVPARGGRPHRLLLLLLVTRLVPGESLFEGVGSIERDGAGRQLARFLAALQQPAARERAEAAVGKLSGAPLPPATTRTLRDRFAAWVRPDQHQAVMRWCDWAGQLTGRQLSASRVTAWHLRNAIGDALWRSESGIPLPDHRDTTRVGSKSWPRGSTPSASTRRPRPQLPGRRHPMQTRLSETPVRSFLTSIDSPEAAADLRASFIGLAGFEEAPERLFWWRSRVS